MLSRIADGSAVPSAVQVGSAHHRLAPHLTEEIAHKVSQRQRRQQHLQLLCITLLQAQFGLALGQQDRGAGVFLDLAACLFDDEGLQDRQLLLVDLDLVDVAVDHFLHQILDQLDEMPA